MNVRGISDQVKRRAIFDYYRAIADILIMQETHSEKEKEKIWENEWGGKAFFSHGTTAARGVAIFVKREFITVIKNVYTDEDGRLILMDLEECGQVTSIVAIYAPNEDSPAYFKKICTLLQDRSENKILIGDFNLVLNIEWDRKNTYNNNNRAKEVVEEISEEYCLVDVWRIQNEEKKEYSWIKAGNTSKASRIDFALVSRGLDQKCKAVEYKSGIKTDHRALYIAVDLQPSERGKGFWKMNASLLQDINYIQLINSKLQEYKKQEEPPILKWENLKALVKKETVKYSRNRGSENRIIIANLQEKVNEYEASLPLTEEEDVLLEKTKADLEEKMLERAKGIIFRSKVRWYEQGEKNTKYFFSLEKSKYNAKTCFKILDEGKEVTETDQILEIQRKFYTDLYSKDHNVIFDMENTYNIVVPEQIRENQNSQITITDLEQAIKTMKNNKTPGEDGIPVDFYKVFWTELKDVFYQMLLECFSQQELHKTARQGILNLIPKANKDSRHIKNLRPITLLNTDYKIIEKAIANKMIPALDEIIHKDQRGFMKDRRISVNIRKMLDIMHQAEKEDLEAVVLSLDFVKCFDKCSFSILHGSLEYFQFGEVVKQWTEILYKNFQVKIQNNGHFSQNILIEKGVHQGGCCSSVYFLVIAELLAISMRHNENIEGITIKEIKSLLNQFADDMDIFSLSTEKSIKEIIAELNRFRQQSGFTVSYDKTTLYRIGSLRHSNAKLYNIDEFKWSNEDINVLGITIAHEDILEKNYSEMPEKIKKILNSWHNRGLSLIGKVQVVNTLVASLFVYKMMVLPSIPKIWIKRFENIIREFLWNGKKSKISFKILQNVKREGGLNLVNLKNKEIALKSTWPAILQQEQEYASLVYTTMRVSALGENIWRCNLKPEDVKKLKLQNQFWEDVLWSWSCYNHYHNQGIENQIIWYNSNIIIGGKPFFWEDACRKGLMYVYQLFEEQRFKTQRQIQSEFGITEMRLNSLKAAMPKEWKDFFLQNMPQQFMPILPHTLDKATGMYSKTFSRVVYESLSDDIMLLHNKYLGWRTDLGEDYCEGLVDFGVQHVEIYKTTNIAKYRSFQYRFLQRALVTNTSLYKWKIISTDLCFFCNVEKETAIHLIIRCPVVRNFWQKVFSFIRERFQIEDIDISEKAIVFNKLVIPRTTAVNFICLLTKQYVYKQKCLQKQLEFNHFKTHVRSIENIEKYIAQKNGKMAYHQRKWRASYANAEENVDDFVNEYVNQL